MSDPFTPERLAVARMEAEERAADDLRTERDTRTQARQIRRRKPTPREITAALTAGRRESAGAREYAENWYQHLAAWRTREVKLSGSFNYDPGEFIGATTLGGRPLPTTYLATPIGELDERNVGQTITDMARGGTVELRHLGKLLDRLRHETHACPLSLLHTNGRGWSGERGLRYGIAVLTLAVRLGDLQAERFLPVLRRLLAG